MCENLTTNVSSQCQLEDFVPETNATHTHVCIYYNELVKGSIVILLQSKWLSAQCVVSKKYIFKCV